MIWRGVAKRCIRYPLEALLLGGFFGIFRVLPIEVASAFGGLLGRVIGPRLSTTGCQPLSRRGVLAGAQRALRHLGRGADQRLRSGRRRRAGHHRPTDPHSKGTGVALRDQYRSGT